MCAFHQCILLYLEVTLILCRAQFHKIQKSWHVRAKKTLLTHLIYVLLHLKNLKLRAVEIYCGRNCNGFGTYYRFHFAVGLRKAQRGLLCLEMYQSYLQNPAFSFSNSSSLRTPVGIYKIHLNKMYAQIALLHRNTPTPKPVSQYFQFRIGIRLQKHLNCAFPLHLN